LNFTHTVRAFCFENQAVALPLLKSRKVHTDISHWDTKPHLLAITKQERCREEYDKNKRKRNSRS
jgi:hypothetical protein